MFFPERPLSKPPACNEFRNILTYYNNDASIVATVEVMCPFGDGALPWVMVVALMIFLPPFACPYVCSGHHLHLSHFAACLFLDVET